MRKQVFKSITMLGLLLTLAVASVHAQSRAQVANIPFEFSVGGKSLPAGEYIVRPFTQAGKVLIIRGAAAAVRLTNSIEAPKAADKGTLVFHRYGARYFLREVWTSGERTGRQLVKSKQERTIESQMAAIPSMSGLAQNTYERVEVIAWLR